MHTLMKKLVKAIIFSVNKIGIILHFMREDN